MLARRCCWVLSCGPLMLLTACVPPGATNVPPERFAAGNRPIEGGPIITGRLYVVSQMLAQEQLRVAALEKQLDQRTQQISQLHNDVERLKRHENALRTALRQATVAGAGVAAAGASSTPAATTGTGVTAAATASIRTAGAAAAGRPGAQSATAGKTRRAAAPAPASVAALRRDLTREHQRREAAEQELARLRQETSTPPYSTNQEITAQLTAAKQQISKLRQQLQEEHAARTRLTAEIAKLQQRPPQAATSATSAENAQLRARIKALETDKEAIVNSVKASLAASQRREAELQQQLAAVRKNTPAAGADAATEITTIRDENATLRQRLDEEHQRTELLASKLKVATRVAQLIFKIQAQQEGISPAPPQAPESTSWQNR